MPDMMFQALDLPGLNETAEQVRAIVQEAKSEIESEFDSLGYARPDGIYPEMTVGAVIGPDETAQWATRESTGSGIATLRSLQGTAEAQGGELIPVHIAGINSTDAQGGELDSVEWPTFTLRGAGTIGDMLYSDHVETCVGVVDMGTLNWAFRPGNDIMWVSLPSNVKHYVSPTNYPQLQCAPYTYVGTKGLSSGMDDKTMAFRQSTEYNHVMIRDSAYNNAADFKSAMSGVLLYYELATPITTPISPALPMTYRVQRGGIEAIIVPDGEISAAPIITSANPSNIGSIITDGEVTTPKIANGAVTGQKIASRTISESNITLGTLVEQDFDATFLESLVKANDLSILLSQEGCAYFHPYFKAASVAAGQVLALMGITTTKILPSEISMETPILQDVRFRLVWLNGTELDSGNVFYSADTNTGVITLFATGRTSKCSGVMGIDTSWTVTSI